MVKRGDVPAMRIGRRVLISCKRGEEWIETNASATFARPAHTGLVVTAVDPARRVSRSVTDLPPDLLSIPQAAARLGVSANTGYELARRGQFPGAIKIGAKWRVSVRKLEQYLHGDLAGPPS